MVIATVKYVDPSPIYDKNGKMMKHWSKVEGPFQSFDLIPTKRIITEVTGREAEFQIDQNGFSISHWPVPQASFTDDNDIRTSYYPEVEALVKTSLPGKISQVIIFDHTLRQMKKESVRKPVMQVHVDQTAKAAEARVRRHAPAAEIDSLLKKRYALVNVWRPIGVPAIEYPLAMVDWRTTRPEDYVEVDLLYPDSSCTATHQDDRGIEEIPEAESLQSTAGYQARGETYGIAPNEGHRFYYKKNMTPEDAVIFKCFDSYGPKGGLPDGSSDVACFCAHTAFVDPETPADAPSRRSIEVRCLVFWE